MDRRRTRAEQNRTEESTDRQRDKVKVTSMLSAAVILLLDDPSTHFHPAGLSFAREEVGHLGDLWLMVIWRRCAELAWLPTEPNETLLVIWPVREHCTVLYRYGWCTTPS
jgi:hypothetical protein